MMKNILKKSFALAMAALFLTLGFAPASEAALFNSKSSTHRTESTSHKSDTQRSKDSTHKSDTQRSKDSTYKSDTQRSKGSSRKSDLQRYKNNNRRNERTSQNHKVDQNTYGHYHNNYIFTPEDVPTYTYFYRSTLPAGETRCTSDAHRKWAPHFHCYKKGHKHVESRNICDMDVCHDINPFNRHVNKK